jgi:hypothetical protein
MNQAGHDTTDPLPLVLTDAEWEEIRSALEWQDERPAAQTALAKIRKLLRPDLVHVGLSADRIQHPSGYREKAFAEAWQRANERKGLHSEGVLQGLMYVTQASEVWMGHPANRRGHYAEVITQRDARIVATVVQWLGTNVGWCWLEDAVKACGYELKPTRERGKA